MSLTNLSNSTLPNQPVNSRQITDADIARVLSYAEVEQTLHRAFASMATGRAQIQARTRIDCGAVKLSSMGAIWLDADPSDASYVVAGNKTYTTVGGQFNFLMNVFDLASGKVVTLPGNEITRFRTPALSVLAARGALAGLSTPPRKLALFGAGVQGRAHADALQAAFGFEQIDVVELADTAQWRAEFSKSHGATLRQTDAASALAGADLVVTATRSKQPLFDGNLLKPGAVVCAVGTSLPTGSELDQTTLWRAARVVVEWKPQSCVEAGEIVMGLREGILSPGSIVELADLCAKAPAQVWRKHEDDIVVFKAVGVGLSDVATAWLALDKLKKAVA